MNVYRLFIIMLLMLCGLSVHAVKVMFRYDDSTVRFDSVHNRVLQLFVDKDVPLSVAVIPCDSNGVAYEPNDSAYLALLNAPNIEVCLHGLTHTYTYKALGEFGGLDYTETERRLQKGKAVLKRHIRKEIVTFIPPWNTINDSIYLAMVNNGFHVLSAELFNTPMPTQYPLNYYPETLGHLMGQKGIWNAAEESIFFGNDSHAVCVVMFHAYDLPDEAAWEQLANLLDRCKTDDDTELYTFASLEDSGERADGVRYNANLLSSMLKKWIMHKGVLHSTWCCYLVHALNAILYTLIWIVASLVFMKRNFRQRNYIIGIMIGVTIAIIGFAWWHVLTPLKLLSLVLLLSIILILSSLKTRI